MRTTTLVAGIALLANLYLNIVPAHASPNMYTWLVEGYMTPAADLGSDAQKTCFLAGVGGNLFSADNYAIPGDYEHPPAAIVFRSQGTWELDVYSTYKTIGRLGAKAICLPTVTGRTDRKWWPDWSKSNPYAKVPLGPVTAHRRCFLTGVSNDDISFPTPGSWSQATDSVRVFNDGANWYIGGSGHATGAAACVDVSTSSEWWYEYGIDKATKAYDLAFDYNGVQCVLTGLGGSFQTDSWADGAYIDYDAGLNQWKLKMSSQKGLKKAWVNCFK